ncbi:MAG: U32 family peptidase [Deltaproteobacteria bacterium]|nr:U32 family peptidase [Deltaproteobacteria bacterium]
MKLSVACNFEDSLLEGLKPYPVYEVFGKLTADYFGGGRPSFYLPEVKRPELERFVRKSHEQGIEFNYLLNASAMGNTEYSKEGQRNINEILGWLDSIGVDSVTVANIYFLRLIKRRYPRIKVRISSHRFTATPRQVKFWVDQGADYIVINEVSIHRDFKALEAMQKASSDVELQLIVNNWCRQDCAIAGNHAVGLSAASQSKNKGFPLDYCSVLCNDIRLKDPVNYLRANWIRPEDLHLYEDLGYHNYKIVERNTPTQVLLDRVKAYSEKKYDGNLLDLVQNYAYPEDKFGKHAKDAYSFRRMFKYFVKPRAINLMKFTKVVEFGKTAGVLYPRRGKNPVQIDNRALDGFIDFFKQTSCHELNCEECQYCHKWAAKVVKVDPEWHHKMSAIYDDLLGEIDSGSFWDPYLKTATQVAGKLIQRVTGHSG